MKVLYSLSIIVAFGFSLICAGCGSVSKKSPIDLRIEKFLSGEEGTTEVFRVAYVSDRYRVAQMRFPDRIQRVEDENGDKYMCDELKRYDKIDVIREGIISVTLFPDSGRLHKARPVKLTGLMEIEKLLMEDVQRWSFTFPRKVVEPTKFDIRYMVVLRKNQSDEEIMKEVRERIKEKSSSR